MDDKLITQALNEAANQEIPDTMNRWNEIQAKLQQIDQTTILVVPKPTRHLSRMMLVAAILLISAGAFAFYQTRYSQFALDIICQEEGFHELGISQTVDGVTATLERAYADTQVVRMVVRIEGLPYTQFSKDLQNGAGLMYDDAGNLFSLVYEPDATPCPYVPLTGTTPRPDNEILSSITANAQKLGMSEFVSLQTYYDDTYGGTPPELRLNYRVTLRQPQPTPIPPTPVSAEATAEPQPHTVEYRNLLF
ncbi:MAG: hypothetical protein H7Y11_15095, partial [Armatimonadetes bacterium]|nr:hypothetical protein [Anaerolineae bacterium]